MKLRRLLLRYYPPGVIVEFHRTPGGAVCTKTIDLLDLTAESEIDSVVSRLASDPLLSSTQRSIITKLVCKLVDKLSLSTDSVWYENFRAVQPHILPMTNCAINKDGSLFATSSYGGVCKVWDSFSGLEVMSLEGVQSSVVYALTFNNPFSSRIITGSFDGSVTVWDIEAGGKPVHHLAGHKGEVLCVEYCHTVANAHIIASGSVDSTCVLWNMESGKQLFVLRGHTAEVVSLCFSGSGELLLSGAMDGTARVWNMTSGECLHVLLHSQSEHSPIACVQFAFDSSVCVTGSVDKSVGVWRNGVCLSKIVDDHSDDILDVQFNSVGSLLVTACADGYGRIFDLKNLDKISRTAKLSGHTGEVTRARFSANGLLVVTCSADATCRVWTTAGVCLQIIEGHSAELFACHFNYEADLLVTASKDNTCRIWRRTARGADQRVEASRARALSSLDSIGIVGLEDAAYRLKVSEEEPGTEWKDGMIGGS